MTFQGQNVTININHYKLINVIITTCVASLASILSKCLSVVCLDTINETLTSINDLERVFRKTSSAKIRRIYELCSFYILLRHEDYFDLCGNYLFFGSMPLQGLYQVANLMFKNSNTLESFLLSNNVHLQHVSSEHSLQLRILYSSSSCIASVALNIRIPNNEFKRSRVPQTSLTFVK